MSRKTMEREARQRFVLDAARQVFMDRGVENTRMEDIATAVDYTRRTLYAYFRGRDEICLLVFLADLAVRWDMQREAMQKASTGLSKVLAWGESHWEYAGQNPHAMRLQFYWDFRGVDRDRIGADNLAAFEEFNNKLADGLRTAFRLGIRDGSLRSDLQIDLCISQYTYGLRSALNRALSRSYSFATFDPDEYVQHYLDLFCRGIRNPERHTE